MPHQTTAGIARLPVIAAAAIVLGALAFAAPAPQQRAEMAVPVLVKWTGARSAIEQPRVERIADPERWVAVWKEHRGDGIEKNARNWPVWPEVDFERCMVLCIFGGRSTNTDGWNIESVADRGADLLVRYDAMTFQTASFGGEPDHGASTSPYGIFVLPRSAKPIVMEENVQGLIGRPPVWKEKHRFPALSQ
ncbi:MAG: hypothetical protein KDA22_12280 [Phycisphaerales bacterium]|nr:hypothetical protein [Phycisphaerales bacterium]